MNNRKWYEWMLTLVYIVMVLLCVYLNFTPGHRESLATIIVNVVMFIIVAIIFLSSDFGSFMPMNSMIRDLIEATAKIKRDALNTHSYLWEPYQNSNVKLFKNELLAELFQDFIFELNREEDPKNVYYRPSIDDYINEDLVDKTMHRNELNQVPGILTGLGILGTFIGLSLGLQSFNTGTTAEMTASIEPLMNGIKVAFHTSIYGMIFSLTYNVIYKKKLYEAEEAVFNFISAFKKYVLPDTANDGRNQLIALQEQNLEIIKEMSFRTSRELAEIMEPHLEKLGRTIVDFENVATRSQEEALDRVVNSFIGQMNQSLGNTFSQINNAVNEEYGVQKQNAQMMQEVLKATGASSITLNDINNETGRLVLTLNKYSESIQAIQNELQKTLSVLGNRNQDNESLLSEERALVLEQQKMILELREAIDKIVKSTNASNDRVGDSLEEISNGIDYICRSIEKSTSRR